MTPIRQLIAFALKSATWSRCALGVAILLAIGSGKTPAVELIRNGSFESDEPGSGSVGTTGWDDGSGQGNDIGFGRLTYPFFSGGQQSGCACFEFPPNFPEDFEGVFRPAGAGNYWGQSWGAGNGNGRNGSATQIVDLRGRAGQPYVLSGWMPSQPGDPEHAILSMDFFSDAEAMGNSLGSIVFDGNDQSSSFIVGSLNVDGLADPTIPPTQNNWTLYRASGMIPLDAESAAVVVRGVSPPGNATSANLGFVDLVSLQVIPEPATAILAVSAILGCALFVRSRRQFAARERIPAQILR